MTEHEQVLINFKQEKLLPAFAAVAGIVNRIPYAINAFQKGLKSGE